MSYTKAVLHPVRLRPFAGQLAGLAVEFPGFAGSTGAPRREADLLGAKGWGHIQEDVSKENGPYVVKKNFSVWISIRRAKRAGKISRS
eukprot:gene10003-biopygen9540